MRRGPPRKSKSPWASREAARGHEPVAELGWLTMRVVPLLRLTSAIAPTIQFLTTQPTSTNRLAICWRTWSVGNS